MRRRTPPREERSATTMMYILNGDIHMDMSITNVRVIQRWREGATKRKEEKNFGESHEKEEGKRKLLRCITVEYFDG